MIVVLVGLLACGGSSPSVDAPVADTPAAAAAAPAEASAPITQLSEPEQAAMTAAELAATTLGKRLQDELRSAMTGSVAGAVDFCHGNASSLTQAVATETGARLGRSSAKLRNPANAPEGWVQGWLLAQTGKPFANVDGYREVVDLGDRRVARLVRPIPVSPECLACHGDAATVTPAVAAVLKQRYPNDAAFGYAVGDLRGGIWVEVPVVPN